jgi:hypothetical protein
VCISECCLVKEKNFSILVFAVFISGIFQTKTNYLDFSFSLSVLRSPSSNNVYRHHTPPKETPPPQSPFYISNSNVHSNNTNNNNNNNGNGSAEVDSEFVVHRSKGITTLFNMQDPLIPAKLRQSKEKSNNDSKADERGMY